MEPKIQYECNVCGQRWNSALLATGCHPDINTIFICPECKKESRVYDEIKNCNHKP